MQDGGPFVAANDVIIARARELGFEGDVPLLCECPDPRCIEIVRTTYNDFEAARTPPATPLLHPSHGSRAI